MNNESFSSIAALDWPDLTAAVHQVLQTLKEGLNSPVAMSAASAREVPVPAVPGTIGNLRPIVESALREIAEAENKPLREIPASDLAKYKERLYDLLFSRTRQEVAGSNLSGAQLLSNLH